MISYRYKVVLIVLILLLYSRDAFLILTLDDLFVSVLYRIQGESKKVNTFKEP